jgi:hypothetical protein
MTLSERPLITFPYRPVVKLKQGVVIIEWTTAQQHERQQRIADNA